MTDEVARLDGNAAAGPLGCFFAFEAKIGRAHV